MTILQTNEPYIKGVKKVEKTQAQLLKEGIASIDRQVAERKKIDEIKRSIGLKAGPHGVDWEGYMGNKHELSVTQEAIKGKCIRYKVREDFGE